MGGAFGLAEPGVRTDGVLTMPLAPSEDASLLDVRISWSPEDASLLGAGRRWRSESASERFRLLCNPLRARPLRREYIPEEVGGQAAQRSLPHWSPFEQMRRPVATRRS